MKDFEYAIALTGGIATGKSSATEIFSGYGFEIIDADTITHQILDTQAAKIAELFGKQYLSGGKVDRRALGTLVFGNEKKRKMLESLLHPLIQKMILSQSQKLDASQKPYLVDIPLFYESGIYPIKRTVLVYAPREVQLERLVKRENYAAKEASLRLDAQMDIEEKRGKATYVIDNSGDLPQLKRECQRVRDLLLSGNKL